MLNDTDLQVAMDVLGKHGEITVTAEHDQIWFHVEALDYSELSQPGPDVDPQYTDRDGENYVDPSPLSASAAARLAECLWFLDAEVGAWSHYA